MKFTHLLILFFLFQNCNLISKVSQDPCKKIYPNMKCIPAGEFIRGSNDYEPDEKPEAKIYISEFYIDTYEVTNADFQKCLDAGKCRECLKTKKCDYIGPRYGKPYLRPKQPMVGVSWYTAKEYCNWAGKRLPTEAEWEKAARGTNGNLYSWGNEVADCTRAVIEENGSKGCGNGKKLPTDDVGTREPGVYGLYDMAGNSWEYVNDWYTKSYAACGKDCESKDPKGPCNGEDNCPGYEKRVLKGGSWWWNASYARGSKRRAHYPQNYPEYHHFGFRCAKN